jgi:hypothetical protein
MVVLDMVPHVFYATPDRDAQSGADFIRQGGTPKQDTKKQAFGQPFWALAASAVPKNQAIPALALPTMSLQYQLKGGAYNLYDLSTPTSVITGEHRLRLRTDTVAIAFDMNTGKLHEHGSPTRIHSWAQHTRRRLRSSGDLAQANSIVVVSGPLPVDEINKCLTIQGYCRRMFKRLSSLPHGKCMAH